MTTDEGTHYYGDGCQPPHVPTITEDELLNAPRIQGVPVATEIEDDFDPAGADALYIAPSDLKWAESLLGVYAGLDHGDHADGTPKRFLGMLNELTAHKRCSGACMKFKTFPNDGMDEMVVVQGVPFVSMCNHHVVPFIGHAHVAYVPKDKIAGLSKFARVVDHFARTLQVQERLTAQVADYLEEKLEPRGVGVILRGEHLCMTIRGVQKPGTVTTTAAMRGVFSDHTRTAKREFLSYLNGGIH